MSHSEKLGQECRKRAAQKWGLGWSKLSEEQQRGAIALEVVSVVTSVVAPLEKHLEALAHIQAVCQSALYPD